jgi:hypothetical protein
MKNENTLGEPEKEQNGAMSYTEAAGTTPFQIRKGIEKRTMWLKSCLDIGYTKDQLTELENIWDKYKDEFGNMKPKVEERVEEKGELKPWYTKTDIEELYSRIADLESSRDEFAKDVLIFTLNRIFDETPMPSQRPTEDELIKVIDLYKQSLETKQIK